MTYCVALNLDAGLVFAADTRTNAGVDHIASFRKLTVLVATQERTVVVLNAGNLATTQSVLNLARRRRTRPGSMSATTAAFTTLPVSWARRCARSSGRKAGDRTAAAVLISAPA